MPYCLFGSKYMRIFAAAKPIQSQMLRKITLIAGIGISVALWGQEPAALSLDKCLEIALSESPTVKIADLEVRKADYSKKETLGALLPLVSFDGSYNRTLQKQVAYMDLDAFGDMPGMGGDESGADARSGGDQGFKMGLDNMYSLGFQAQMPLIAPQGWASLKLSDIQIAKNAELARASRLDLINQVKNAYYALQLAEDSKKVTQESYDMAAFTHDLYQKRFKVGDASDYEVLRTSVAMKNIEPQLLQCDIAIKRAHLQLAVLMGIEVSTPFTVNGTLAAYDNDLCGQVLALDGNLSQNSQLIQNSIDRRQLAQALKVQKASLYPTLALAGNYSWNSSSNGSPFRNFRWTSYSMVGLSLSIPLYQGGQRYSRIKQAEIQLQEMDYSRQQLLSSLESQAKIAIENIQLNVRQIGSSLESVHEAERAHDIQRQSFDIGASSYLDLRDSELSLTQARLSYYQAIYNYMVANSDLELLLGNADLAKYDK